MGRLRQADGERILREPDDADAPRGRPVPARSEGALAAVRVQYSAILARHAVTHAIVRLDIEQNAREQELRMAGDPVPRDLYTLDDETRDHVGQVRLEVHYLLAPELQDLQVRAWTFPDTAAQFTKIYLDWLDALSG
jgi:hypothetical protein